MVKNLGVELASPNPGLVVTSLIMHTNWDCTAFKVGIAHSAFEVNTRVRIVKPVGLLQSEPRIQRFALTKGEDQDFPIIGGPVIGFEPVTHLLELLTKRAFVHLLCYSLKPSFALFINAFASGLSQ